MKRKVGMVLGGAALSVALMTGQAVAGPFNSIPDSNPAFEPSGFGSIQNVHQPSLRFGQGGRTVIPGESGQHANGNSVVDEHTTGETIIDPQGF